MTDSRKKSRSVENMFTWVKNKVNGLFARKPVEQKRKPSTRATGRKQRVTMTSELEIKILTLYDNALKEGKNPYPTIQKETFASDSTIRRVLVAHGITPVRAYHVHGKDVIVPAQSHPKSYEGYKTKAKGYDSLKAVAKLPPRTTKKYKHDYKKSWLTRKEVLGVWHYKRSGKTWDEIAELTGINADLVGDILRQKKYSRYTKGVPVV